MAERKKLYEAAVKSDNQSASVVVTQDATSEGMPPAGLINQQ